MVLDSQQIKVSGSSFDIVVKVIVIVNELQVFSLQFFVLLSELGNFIVLFSENLNMADEDHT
jgi:hypothetical protein